MPEILVLAAGRAQRFGADKRRIVLDGDESLLECTVTQLSLNRLPITVCLAARRADDALADFLRSKGLRVIRSARAAEGMGSTLAEAVRNRGAAPALIIALGDMPLVDPATVRALCRQWRPSSIVVPVSHDGQRGHPVLFDRCYFDELGQLHGERGAASILERHREYCLEIPVTDPGIHLDADTPEALEELRAYRSLHRSPDGP